MSHIRNFYFLICLTFLTSCNGDKPFLNNNERGDKADYTLSSSFQSSLSSVYQSNSVSFIGMPINLGDMQTTKNNKNILSSSVEKSAGFKADISNYNLEQGLPNSFVSSIETDKFGNLWIGTIGGGISRFNGRTFTNFSVVHGLSSNFISDILKDKKGNIWVASTGGGIIKYDGYTFLSLEKLNDLANDTVLCLMEDSKGNIWFGTAGKGVYRFDGFSLFNLNTKLGLAGNTVLSILEDNKGHFWFGTSGDGLSYYDGNNIKNYGSKDGLPGKTIKSLYQDNTGKIWIGTLGNGVSVLVNNKFITYSVKNGLLNDNVWCIESDIEGNVWLGTGGGAVKYMNNEFTNFSILQGLANNSVWCIKNDDYGNLWFGTVGGGISCYRGETLISYTVAEGLPDNYIFSALEDRNGKIWLGTSGSGAVCFDGKVFKAYTTNQGLADNFVWCCFEDKSGNIWFGTASGGVSKFDGNKFTNYSKKNGFPSNTVKSITQDQKGNMWFGTVGDGAVMFDGTKFMKYSTEQGLPHPIVNFVFVDQLDNIWFCTNGGGVARFAGKEFKNYSTSHGLLSNVILSCNQDRNRNMWFTTYGSGISKFDGKSFYTYNSSNGLPDDIVSDIELDSFGNLWLGTNHGFSCLNIGGDSLTISNYNYNNGFAVNEINPNAMCITSKGIIWSGTANKLVRFNTNKPVKKSRKSFLNISRISINHQFINWSNLLKQNNNKVEELFVIGKLLSDSLKDQLKEKFKDILFDSISSYFYLPNTLTLPSENNTVTFEFFSSDPSLEIYTEYAYMLKGNTEEWSVPSKNNQATFTNLNAGTFTFHVRSRKPNEKWSEPVSYKIRILSPWYKTWWMFCLYLILVVGIFVGISWVRNRAQRKYTSKLESEIKNRTKDLLTEQKKTQKLLLNILPEQIAHELKNNGFSEPKMFDNVTVMFTDFVGFTQIAEKLSPSELVHEIHECFKYFDMVAEKYGIEKIKTIGDAYLAAGGLPVINNTHALNVVNAAIEIRDFVVKKAPIQLSTGEIVKLQIRIGIHTGPVVAGIVGVKKYAYDIWGDTVNTANRMEQTSEPNKINISEFTYLLIKNSFNSSYRGEVFAKGKGKIKMYYVECLRN